MILFSGEKLIVDRWCVETDRGWIDATAIYRAILGCPEDWSWENWWFAWFEGMEPEDRKAFFKRLKKFSSKK